MKPHKKSLAMTIALAAAFALVAVWPGGANAEGPTTRHFTLKPIPDSAFHHYRQAPRVRNANGSSSNWSGYAAYPIVQSSPSHGKKHSSSTPTFSDVVGSWYVPQVSASTSTNTYSSTWVGLDGYNDSTVEQIGTEQDWSNGSDSYYAWFEMYPKGGYQIDGFPVNPGDEISAEVQYTSKGSFTLTIVNVTQNVYYTTTQVLRQGKRLSANWITEAPWLGGELPLADFGTVDMFGCSATMNGHVGAIDDSMWQNDDITMETSNGTVKAQPSNLTNGGTAFSVTWQHE